MLGRNKQAKGIAKIKNYEAMECFERKTYAGYSKTLKPKVETFKKLVERRMLEEILVDGRAKYDLAKMIERKIEPSDALKRLYWKLLEEYYDERNPDSVGMKTEYPKFTFYKNAKTDKERP
jgi:hypothetical protein